MLIEIIIYHPPLDSGIMWFVHLTPLQNKYILSKYGIKVNIFGIHDIFHGTMVS